MDETIATEAMRERRKVLLALVAAPYPFLLSWEPWGRNIGPDVKRMPLKPMPEC